MVVPKRERQKGPRKDCADARGDDHGRQNNQETASFQGTPAPAPDNSPQQPVLTDDSPDEGPVALSEDVIQDILNFCREDDLQPFLGLVLHVVHIHGIGLGKDHRLDAGPLRGQKLFPHAAHRQQAPA